MRFITRLLQMSSSSAWGLPGRQTASVNCIRLPHIALTFEPRRKSVYVESTTTGLLFDGRSLGIGRELFGWGILNQRDGNFHPALTGGRNGLGAPRGNPLLGSFQGRCCL